METASDGEGGAILNGKERRDAAVKVVVQREQARIRRSRHDVGTVKFPGPKMSSRLETSLIGSRFAALDEGGDSCGQRPLKRRGVGIGDDEIYWPLVSGIDWI